MVNTGIDLVDIFLDLFQIKIDYESYVKEVQIGSNLANATQEEKNILILNALIEKFSVPMKSIVEGSSLAEKAAAFVVLLENSMTYTFSGIKSYFSNWRSWLKFGVMLSITVAETLATDGEYLIVKLGNLALDIVSFAGDITSTLQTCEEFINK